MSNVMMPPVRSSPTNARIVPSDITPVSTHSGSGPFASERESISGGPASSELKGHVTSHAFQFELLVHPSHSPFATFIVASSMISSESYTKSR